MKKYTEGKKKVEREKIWVTIIKNKNNNLREKHLREEIRDQENLRAK